MSTPFLKDNFLKITDGTLLLDFVLGVGFCIFVYRGAGKSLAGPGRKKATATENFDFHISYLWSLGWRSG